MSCFVTLEGIEGSGKSTLRAKLAEYTQQLGREVVITREPGATELGRTLRGILLNPETKNLDTIAEVMLFGADRAQHVSEVIKPAIDRGAVVICDRFYHSTLAYQGYGRGIDLTMLKNLMEIVSHGVEPDLVLLLDLDPSVSLERVKARTSRSTLSFHVGATEEDFSGIDRFEEQSVSFHRAVRKGFLNLAAAAKDTFVVLDANETPEAVSKIAIAAIKQCLAAA